MVQKKMIRAQTPIRDGDKWIVWIEPDVFLDIGDTRLRLAQIYRD